MITINIYLTFDGNCKIAFDYYQSIFGGEFASSSTFGEMPPQEGMPPISEEMKDKIMHVSLPLSKETLLMGSDTGGEWGPPFQAGNNFSISVRVDSKEKANEFFASLSEGGKVTMPIGDTFWGDYFGSCTDKFGVNWMVAFGA